MPMIANFYNFSPAESNVVKDFLDRGNTYQDWGCDELMGVRSNLREFYRLQQKGRCAYCMQPISLNAAANAQVEHILPKSLHAEFMFEVKNLCVICADCNQAKRDKAALNGGEFETLNGAGVRYPLASSRFLIVHPAIDDYSDHIAIRGKHYINITAKGHYMIGICNLNRHIEKFGYKQDALDEFDLIQLLNQYADGGQNERRQVYERLRDILV